ncbi:hypothetical protein HO173_004941 [Letharia columbiana]|uniref:Uncharacterized protein n=1 Tax=Letharia columbiana TaxID=112416 RepID=A0A8H6L5R6_9LECA|nr:uncharacterized protein HO173_004941 [Letharia columbiana]KAF6236650.1 hypothetical protein HO173_004941 [Letharia columbiana]
MRSDNRMNVTDILLLAENAASVTAISFQGTDLNIIASTVTTLRSKVQKTYSQGREVMDAKQQEVVCTQIGSKVRVLYPTPEDSITIVPSTESIKNLATRATDSSDRASRVAHENLQEELSAQAISEGEALGEADDVLDAQRNELWDFQNRVNSSSAVLRTITMQEHNEIIESYESCMGCNTKKLGLV